MNICFVFDAIPHLHPAGSPSSSDHELSVVVGVGDLVTVLQVDHHVVAVQEQFIATEAAFVVDFLQRHQLTVLSPVVHDCQPMVLLGVTSHGCELESLATNVTIGLRGVLHVVAVSPDNRLGSIILLHFCESFETPPVRSCEE